MSLTTNALNVTGSIGGVAQSASNLARLVGGSTGWDFRLAKASWGGIPFAVESTRSVVGRRFAIHEYPFREEQWVEDIGKLPARFEIEGYLVEDSLIYGGGPVKAQREAMRVLCETKGIHTLQHPTFGNLDNMVCLNVEFNDDRAGLVIGVNFTFMRAGLRQFPNSGVSGGSQSKNTAILTRVQALLNFVKSTASAILLGAAVVQQAVSTAVGWYQFAVTAIGDVKRIIGSVSTLFGNFGHLFGGANDGFGGANPQAPSDVTAHDLLAEASAACAAVVRAGTALIAAAANPADSVTLGAAVQTLIAAVAAIANDPADEVRIISTLAAYAPPRVSTPGPFGAAMQTMQDATSALFRRYALAQLAVTLTTYQPASQDDAYTVLRTAAGLFDAEITIAGDAGDDESYQALRATRQAVIADLTTRGADLSVIAWFSFQASLPSLVLANRIYRDPTREPGLVQQIDPRHPAFCPPMFRALAA